MMLIEKNKRIEIMEEQYKRLEFSLLNTSKMANSWDQKVQRANLQIQKQKKINLKKKLPEKPEYIDMDIPDLNSYFNNFNEKLNNENFDSQNVKQGISFKLECEEQLNRTLKRIL